MAMKDERSLGQIAYEGYCADSGGKSLVSGAQLPTWSALVPEIQHAWSASASAVVDSMMVAASQSRPSHMELVIAHGALKNELASRSNRIQATQAEASLDQVMACINSHDISL